MFAYSKIQLAVLFLLRMLIGWHLLFEGLSKFFNPGWSSASFLKESQWIMSGVANWIISNPTVLSVADFLNIWGLIAIGLGLILGLFSRIAAFSGAILLLVYFFNNAPIIGIEYSIPSEGSYLLVNKTLIESVSLLVLALFPTSNYLGLDALIKKWRTKS